MKISVIIPALNEEKFLPDCLEALQNQIEKPDEIIVVDNGSTDLTPKIAERFDCKVVFEKKRGITFARNKGFETAKYEIIARTDADTIPPKDWIKNIKEAVKKHKEACAITGPVVFYDLPLKITLPSTILIKSGKILDGGYFLLGPNMVVKKSAWKKVKDYICLNDKEVHEDFDLSIHLHEQGLKVAFDKNLINHISGRRIKHHPTSFFVEYPFRLIKMLKNH